MKATVVIGGQFGDEGKGKIISYLAFQDEPAAAVRGGVGPNAGHTVLESGRIFRIRMIPSAFVNPKVQLMIGPGVLVDPEVLLDEIRLLDVSDRIIVDRQCGIIEQSHRSQDKGGHLKNKIGTTGTGTGPANADRALRAGKIATDIEPLSKYLGDIPHKINGLIDEGKPVLVEGTQGTFLSLYHGTYPFVTSKDVTASAVCSDVGLGPKKVGDVLVVLKSYVTRVGEGPLEDELREDDVLKMGWKETGTVTGRIRRAAPFNFGLAERGCMLNGATQIALTKLDAVFTECTGIKKWQDLPHNAKEFVYKVESSTRVPVALIGTGPNIDEIIDRRSVA